MALPLLMLLSTIGLLSTTESTTVATRTPSPWGALLHGNNVCTVPVSLCDNKTLADDAVASTVADCCARYPAGAVVYFPPCGSAYRLARSLELRSNLTLLLGASATLFAAQVPSATQPGASCSRVFWEKQNTTGILCGVNLTNIAIVGMGANTSLIDGGGWPWYRAGLFGQGPRLFEVVGSRNVTLSHVGFINSPSWTVHPVQSQDVLAENIHILNPRFTPKYASLPFAQA